MAGRGFSPVFLAELLQSRNQPVYLVQEQFDDISYYQCDAWRDISWNGNTWKANGHFLDFQGLTESYDMQIPRVTVSISAVDQTWISISLTKPYIGRPIRIYKALLDYTMSVITSPGLIFEGRMDGLSIEDDPQAGKCALVMECSNQWADFDRKPGRHTNHQDQQVFFPGDTGFQFVPGLANLNLSWGTTNGSSTVPGVQPTGDTLSTVIYD
ncbi:MAG TPA: hypothetical protein VGK09_08400 [Rhodocyclaceae bacterium]|jgi:hypothetical protein